MGPVPKKDICSIYELVWNQQPHVRLRHMKNKNRLINKWLVVEEFVQDVGPMENQEEV
jgi:hypothetical protein